MQQEDIIICNQDTEEEEELTINLKKIWASIVNRKDILVKIFGYVLLFFILLTFIIPKKYTVISDIYINKSNNSNLVEFNPYVLNEAASGSLFSMGVDKAINNEIELMKSEMVLDKVIRENNIRIGKKFGIIPMKRTGEYLTAKEFYGKGKVLRLENVKNTNVISIRFKARKPEVAYGVVNSLINNYIELHKELNSEKSKFDKELLKSQYEKAKEALELKLQNANGLPTQAGGNITTLSAMSAYSTTANKAINAFKGQYMKGQRTQAEVSEEIQKLTQLATKLEWAELVDQMSDSSKVLVLTAPRQLRPFENSSPNLKLNIIIGIIFGLIADLIALIYLELTDKKLAYSTLSNNIVYSAEKDFDGLKSEILCFSPKKILLVSLAKLSDEFLGKIKEIKNAEVIYADLSSDFVDKLSQADEIMLISKIGETNTDVYKKISNIIKKQKKTLLYDVLL
ncbi:hypothetical protein IKQ26_01360 [bacterium]|nr:hypothetical protein [bacterium]